jgi:DNA (cytosine-5)-methyltransferase 1
METLKTSTGEQLNDLTLFVVDTPANPLAPLANDEEPTTLDTYGRGLEQPLANYDPTTQSWKTSEDTSLWGELKLLVNLPKSGMTHNGALYLQPEWVRPIDANDLLSWPTPTTQEIEHPNAELTTTGRRKSKNGKTSHSLGLADAVQIWPTPQAHDAKHLYSKPKNSGQQMLSNWIYQRDNSTAGGKLNPTWVEWLMGFPTGWTDLED